MRKKTRDCEMQPLVTLTIRIHYAILFTKRASFDLRLAALFT